MQVCATAIKIRLCHRHRFCHLRRHPPRRWCFLVSASNVESIPISINCHWVLFPMPSRWRLFKVSEILQKVTVSATGAHWIEENCYLTFQFLFLSSHFFHCSGITGKKKKPFIDYHSSSSNRVKVHSNALGSSNYKHSSKVFYLPTKFVSNGKPVKPILFSSTSKVNNNSGKRKFYQHYYGSKKRLKYGQF